MIGDEDEPKITVAQLIEMLQALPQDLPVHWDDSDPWHSCPVMSAEVGTCRVYVAPSREAVEQVPVVWLRG